MVQGVCVAAGAAPGGGGQQLPVVLIRDAGRAGTVGKVGPSAPAGKAGKAHRQPLRAPAGFSSQVNHIRFMPRVNSKVSANDFRHSYKTHGLSDPQPRTYEIPQEHWLFL
eukprot:Hpha_TRINITY_DN35392_c0_g1::TRINITY_DN35392_c0_g1_i1::g.85183::m.85183